ncbi:homeobox-DDT domain protein RLT3 [Typha latifolia]|uniref:homeobox-DDT domain protein RLT3 n=1 Tax=Typha latifolia TaxID=4733 RepID=UPI003C30D1CD
METVDINAKNDNGAKKKSPIQLQSLEKFYSEEKYPKQRTMEEYAVSLDLTYSQVRIWFVERRRKERKEKEKHHFHKKDNQGVARTHTLDCSSRWSCNGRLAKSTNRFLGPELKKSVAKSINSAGKKRFVRLQVLFPKDYILRKIFRKDGPTLGSQFDPIPQKVFGYHTDGRKLHSCYGSQTITKKRKVLESPIEDTAILHKKDVPAKKHGIGKGLMTVWHATNSDNGHFPADFDLLDGNAALRSLRSHAAFKEIVCRVPNHQKLGSKQIEATKRIDKRQKPSLNKRKVKSTKILDPKRPHANECKLSIDEPHSSEQQNELATFVDDEELELRELQAGPNPLRCSAHLASSGRHACPLCKDLLARFPPQTVNMKQPFLTRPWDSSPGLVKKLFKVLRFLYTRSICFDVNPFTLDELTQAFHDKDSLLLGKVHVALLKLLFLEVEREKSSGFIPCSFKDCRFLSFLNFVREQEFDVNFWSQSLNPLTWIEILRQVLVAAGFGSKHRTLRRDIFNKERNRMTKYGLRPRTLKGELFSLLASKGSGGSKVSELAKSPQIAELDLPSTIEGLEKIICSTLSSDITLFEKIAPSAYRLRVDPQIKGKEDPQSDSEDSGSVDNDSADASTSSSGDDSDDSNEMNSIRHERRIVKSKVRVKKVGRKLTEYSEIDESYSGEAWVLGLMEGEYADLSIDEKLDTLIALIDLVVGAGPGLRIEEPERSASVILSASFHGSGAKIKKSSTSYQLPSSFIWKGSMRDVKESSQHSFPIDSSLISSKSKNGQAVDNENEHQFGDSRDNSEVTEVSGQDVHPLQSIYLGSDRRYNNYWLFLGPCTTNDPGHRRVYFESSEDGHWEVIDSTQALLALLSVLDSRGTREARLLASLEKRQAFLCQTMESYMKDEHEIRQTRVSDPSDLENSSGSGSSPISDIDNSTVLELTNNFSASSGVIALELGRKGEEKKQKWERSQAFDQWIWSSFYSVLNAIKFSKRSYMESLTRCESCHDLYWRDEKHCRICHSTFEIDFDLEERYAVHVATCREPDGICDFPKHKVLPSQLQALKAAIHAIEATMPEITLASSWMKSAHKLWVKRLRRTSSLPELLQVVADFVGAINEDWLSECASMIGSNSSVDDIIVYFQTMPQTTSAVALWIVKLDSLIAPHLKTAQSGRTDGSIPLLKSML